MVAMHYNRGNYYARMARQRLKVANRLKLMLADLYVANAPKSTLDRLARIIVKVEVSYYRFLAMEVLP